MDESKEVALEKGQLFLYDRIQVLEFLIPEVLIEKSGKKEADDI